MAGLEFSCITATTFAPGGAFDEAAFRAHLAPLVEARFGLFLGSGGTGESHSLTAEEMTRMYRAGVAAGAGKVPVHAQLPEESTAQATREQIGIAVAAGVDALNIYPVEGRHGFKPTERELNAYFDDIFAGVTTPVALTVSETSGYTPPARLIAALCGRHRCIKSVLLMRGQESQLIELKRALDPGMPVHVEFETASIAGALIGVTGLISSEANIIPRTTRRFLDLYLQRDLEALGPVYADMKRFRNYVRKWGQTSARWMKMCMKALKLPGGEGGVRRPLLLPPDDEMKDFTAGLLRLDIAEINDLARKAGLQPPA